MPLLNNLLYVAKQMMDWALNVFPSSNVERRGRREGKQGNEFEVILAEPKVKRHVVLIYWSRLVKTCMALTDFNLSQNALGA